MGNVEAKLDYVSDTKAAIRAGIVTAGGTVADEDTLRSYVNKVTDLNPRFLSASVGDSAKNTVKLLSNTPLSSGGDIADLSVISNEIFTYTTFASAGDWTVTGGWSITGGKAVFTTTDGLLKQTVNHIWEGSKLKWVFTISTNTAYIEIRDSQGAVLLAGASYAIGTHTVYFTMPENEVRLSAIHFFASASLGNAFSMDDISLKIINPVSSINISGSTLNVVCENDFICTDSRDVVKTWVISYNPTSTPVSSPTKSLRAFTGNVTNNITYINISLIGDSIMYYPSWALLLDRSIYRVSNKAAGGTAIASMATQVASILGDNPDIVICNHGINDNNAGDMAALQSAVETNLQTLKTTFPTKSIYYINPQPMWTDLTGTTLVAKDNIRNAIYAACAAKSIPCWDTTTVPWIIVSDTYDALHPNTSGMKKQHAEISARI